MNQILESFVRKHRGWIVLTLCALAGICFLVQAILFGMAVTGWSVAGIVLVLVGTYFMFDTENSTGESH